MKLMSVASKGSNAPEDDSDLEDLIAKQTHRSAHVDFGGSSASPPTNPISYCGNVIRLCVYTCPKLCKCTVLLASLCLLGFLSNTIFNPSITTGIMGADYSDIKSAYDLSLSQVDHWCIRGDNDSCKCEDPLEPTPRAEFKAWTAAHKANVADVNMYRAIYGGEPTKIDVTTNTVRPSIDVAFLGESVVEAMDGRWLGKKIVKVINTDTSIVQQDNNGGKKPDIGKVFERFFRKDKGGPLEGVALGIAGDNTANVLWRLQHDEMPYDFNPKVWWLVLGMNDLTRMQCSEEIVVLGILRVVEEIMLRKPDAYIVINSLLPMLDYRSEDVKMSDVVDFKTDPDTKLKENMEIERVVKGFVGRPKEKGNWKFVPLKKGELPPQQHAGGHSFRRLQKGHERVKGVETGPDRNLKKLTKKQKKEDEAMDGPDLKNAINRAKKDLARRDKKFMNKKFSDNERFHPKRPLSPFLPMLNKKALPPVWPAVHLINEKLKEFCSKHEQVTFFDATSIFANDIGGGKHNLNSDLISPRGHPSELGFAVWEGRIMGRLDSMFKEMAPPPPAPTPPPEADEEEEENDDEVVENVVDLRKETTKVLGSEHVSEGKIAEEPPPKQQPPRNDALIEEEEKVESKGAPNTKKRDEEDKNDYEKDKKKIDSKLAKENEEEDDDDENEEADDDDEEEAKIDSKTAKADDKSTENMKEDKEEEVGDEGKDDEDDE